MFENNFTKIPNEFAFCNQIANEEMLLYVLICINLIETKSISENEKNKYGIAYFNISDILNQLGIANNNTKRIIQIKSTILSLLKPKTINIGTKDAPQIITKQMINGIYTLNGKAITERESINNGTYIASVEVLKSNYFIVRDKDINAILSYASQNNIDKAKLIRYFCLIMREISHNKKGDNYDSRELRYGYMTQNFLLKQHKEIISNSSCITKYNTILQDLKLILFNNNYLTPSNHYISTYFTDNFRLDSDGNVFQSDIEKFNKYILENVNEKSLIKSDKKTSNKKRSIKKKISNAEKLLSGDVSNFSDEQIEQNVIKLNRLKDEHKKLQYKELVESEPEPTTQAQSESTTPIVRTFGKPKPVVPKAEPIEQPTPSQPVIDIVSGLDEEKSKRDLEYDAESVKMFLGNYAFLYKSELSHIRDKTLSIQKFCAKAHVSYSEYLQFIR